ncbi:MAG TPA: dTDP-4-dehydrorhamnose 3,5-epimerase [Hyphomicrobiaceae bacterium]|nr:dTDP-4-dehydrorhamnose 3,5-epimerase [Hyphomicrobiaceae bacterium]
MKFHPTKFQDAWLVELEPFRDERGSFARTFCAHEFGARGLETNFLQHSVSMSSRKGTIRGMHFQREPHAEVKLVRCIGGAIWDVIIDLRPGSGTFRQWQAFELTEDNGRQLYIPKGFAHGFQTMTDRAEVSYLISAEYAPEAAMGVRWNDPAFAIAWPLANTAMSDKDRNWPDFRDQS